ncbi:MAG TPA: class I SAM-dependent methyltransferase [Dongiaceae bacterium]|jgi:hypothetical protein
MHGVTSPSDTVAALLAPLVEGKRLVRELDEPLRESAPLAFEIAHSTCADEDCCTYHSMWQYLRLAGIHRGLQVDGPLFVAAAERMAGDGALNRALVSGTADYSILAHIAHGARRGGANPSFQVVDQCATTLRMNQWYGARRGFSVTTFRSDIFAFRPEARYDLICTHAFLGFHSFADRPMLFQRWAEWLAPGGRLCFSNTVSDQPIPADIEGRKKRIAEKTAKGLRLLAEQGVPLPCPQPRFEELVRQFGLRQEERGPAMSLETVCSWIEDAGLDLEIAVPVKKALPGEPDLPAFSDRGPERPRIWFQARRP